MVIYQCDINLHRLINDKTTLTITLTLKLTSSMVTNICKSKLFQMILTLSFALPPLSVLLIAIVREEGVEVGKLLPGWQQNTTFVR